MSDGPSTLIALESPARTGTVATTPGSGMSPEKNPPRHLDWERTRELYTNWVAEWGQSSSIKHDLQWRGFSLWWCSNLVHKDAEVHKAWFENIHYRLSGSQNITKSERVVLFKGITFLKLFIADVLRWLLVKALFPRQKILTGRIWFHSLSNNLRLDEGVAYDRMFSTAHLKDKEYGLTSAYAITLSPKISDLINPASFKRRVHRFLSGIQRDAVILNGFVTLPDIIKVHIALCLKWRKLMRLSKEESFRQGFTIDGVRCDDILIDELEHSFLGPMQWSLLYATSFRRWLEKLDSPQLIVTYAETDAYIRPVYHFSKVANAKNRFISIQHSIVCRNKLSFYHRRSEFSQGNQWDGIHHSPMPDYYFVQGRQFQRILEEFYPASRIKPIGCLKYDTFVSVLRDREKYAIECRTKLGNEQTRIMVIAPSVNDAQDILEIFKDVAIPSGWRVVISPHPFMPLEGYRNLIAEMKITVPIEFSPGLPTYKLLTVADLVVCGYSAVAFEAAIFGVRSARMASESTYPQFEDEPEVPSFRNKEDFWRWFDENFKRTDTHQRHCGTTDRLVADYFYRVDGKSADRLWEGIRSVVDAAHR